MKILEIKDKIIWEEFLRSVREKTFLQSWNWGEFQKAMGEKIWRLGIYEAGELIGVCLIVKISARRGKFLFVPHGPIFVNYELGIMNYGGLIEFLKNLAKKEKCGFIRISPIFEENEPPRCKQRGIPSEFRFLLPSSPQRSVAKAALARRASQSFLRRAGRRQAAGYSATRNKEHEQLFKELGFRDAPSHMHAELTWILDITKNEEELLAGMRKTTRNLIKRGEREGLEVRQGTLDVFYRLYQATEKRQQFVAFPKNYLQKELDALGDDAQIFLASHQGTILAGAVIIFYDGVIYYHHGASLHSQIPAAYTLQWEIIKEAKKRGMKYYNFWGVVKEDEVKHPWRGLSLFKRGFGGREWPLMHAKDMPLSWSYWLSWGVDQARKWRRGY